MLVIDAKVTVCLVKLTLQHLVSKKMVKHTLKNISAFATRIEIIRKIILFVTAAPTVETLKPFFYLPACTRKRLSWYECNSLGSGYKSLKYFCLINRKLATVCYYHVTYEFQSEYTLYSLPECQVTPYSKQAPYLKFK